MSESYPEPDYQLVVNGQNITPQLGKRLKELRLRESRGEEADQLDITLDDADGRMAIPPKGAAIELRLGWAGSGLVDKGSFIVDETEHSGTPDTLQIRARSADMAKALRSRASHSWHDTTLGKIVGDIAARNGLPARLDADLASRKVQHMDQTNESDLHFCTRLARLHDAVCTVKKGQLIFLRTNSRTNASGQVLAPVQITRDVGDQHRWHRVERTSYTGVRAYWHDGTRARRRSVLAGTTVDVKKLKDTYATERDARAAAQAELQRVDRGAATLSLTLALGRPALMPQSPVTVKGFKPEIDGAGWLVKTVEHSLGDGGFVTQLEMELQGSGDAVAIPGDDEVG
jgi:phage protein D